VLDKLKDYPVMLAVLATIVALIPLFKLIHSMFHTNKVLKIQSLDLLSASLKGTETINSFVVEQLFLTHFKISASYDVIKSLLSQPHPSHSLELYKCSTKYVCLSNGKFAFEGKYKCQKRRGIEKRIRPIINFILYFIFGVPGLTLILYAINDFRAKMELSGVFPLVTYILLGGALVIGLVLVCLAFIWITNKSSITKAEQLITKNSSKKLSKWHY
jgi:hypothetical protein